MKQKQNILLCGSTTTSVIFFFMKYLLNKCGVSLHGIIRIRDDIIAHTKYI